MGDLEQAHEKGVILAEGFATAYALHKHSDHTPVVVGFDAHNIVNVAKILKEKLPEDTKLIVAADNDLHLEKAGKTNEGIAGAKQAVAAFGQNATMIYPTFPPEVISGKMSDFDDYQRHVSTEGIKQTISEAKSKLGLSTEQTKGQGISPMEKQPENTSATIERPTPTEAPLLFLLMKSRLFRWNRRKNPAPIKSRPPPYRAISNRKHCQQKKKSPKRHKQTLIYRPRCRTLKLWQSWGRPPNTNGITTPLKPITA